MTENTTPMRTVVCNNIQYNLVYGYRNAESRAKSALQWIKSDSNRVEAALEERRTTGDVQSIASQAHRLAEALVERDVTLDMAKLAFSENLQDFWDLVDMKARPGFAPAESS